MQRSAIRGVPFILQDAATTGDGSVVAVPPGFWQHSVIIKGSAGVSAGAIQLECASANDYSGAWIPIGGGPVTVPDDGEELIQFEGTYLFIRARVSTDVTDGTVTVTYQGVDA